MKKSLLLFLFISIGIYLALRSLLPDNEEISNIVEIVVFYPLLTSIIVPLLNKVHKQSNELNLGLIFFVAMGVIMLIGNVNNFIVRYIFPSFGNNISYTNYYWMGGMVFFAIGYLFFMNRQKMKKYITYIHLSTKLIYFTFFLSFFASIYSFLSLGFIPFFKGAGLDVRYSGSESDSSVIIRLWSLCVIAAVLGINYYYNERKRTDILVISVVSFLLSLFFITRIYPIIILVSLFLILFQIYSKKVKILLGLFSIIAFIFFNALFIDYRSGTFVNSVVNSSHLNNVQKTIYFTFNEYRQLNIAINEYDGEPLYGQTLLPIPVGFIPQQFLAFFGIVKNKIQNNNSAVIMANFLKSNTSTGIRIGIMGDLFLNFRYWGLMFMVFMGLLVGLLQKNLNNLSKNDYRYGIVIILFVISLYSLVGQSDAIGSLGGNYIFFLIISTLFLNKKTYQI